MKTPYYTFKGNYQMLNGSQISTVPSYSGRPNPRPTTLKGKSLILRTCAGNLGHFINDHYYSFFYLANYSRNIFGLDFDHLLISSRGQPEDLHLYLALNCLPQNLKKKVQVLERDRYYNLEWAYYGEEDRPLSLKTKGRSPIYFWRKNFYNNTNPPKKRPPKERRKVFIFQHDSSCTTPGRKILNLKQVTKALEKEGFVVTVATPSFWKNKSAPERVHPFIDCDIFIGCAGAWMANLFLAPPGTKILSLQHPDYADPWWSAQRDKTNKILPASRGSLECYSTGDLGHKFYNISCEWERSYSPKALPKTQGGTLDFSTLSPDSPLLALLTDERSANVRVNSQEIIDVIN
jgi:hypothetical protein